MPSVLVLPALVKNWAAPMLLAAEDIPDTFRYGRIGCRNGARNDDTVLDVNFEVIDSNAEVIQWIPDEAN